MFNAQVVYVWIRLHQHQKQSPEGTPYKKGDIHKTKWVVFTDRSMSGIS